MKSNNCNALSPARQSLTRLPRPLGQGDELVGSVSVTRVQPRTSKGITALERYLSERYRQPASCVHPDTASPMALRQSGLSNHRSIARGISTYLRSRPIGPDPPLCARCNGLAQPRLATGSAPQRGGRSLYQVVLPTSSWENTGALQPVCPTVGVSPQT